MLLDKLFSTKSKIMILREMAKSEEGISVSDLAEKIGLNKMTVSKMIKQLEKEGIIKTQIKGNLKLSKLNDKIKYSSDIIDLFKWEEAIDSELEKMIASELSKEYPNNLSIILFGSRARKEERIDSDFDIMIVVPKGKKKVETKKIKGLNISIFLINKDEFKEKFEEKDPLISNVYIEGKVLKGMKNYEKLIR